MLQCTLPAPIRCHLCLAEPQHGCESTKIYINFTTILHATCAFEMSVSRTLRSILQLNRRKCTAFVVNGFDFIQTVILSQVPKAKASSTLVVVPPACETYVSCVSHYYSLFTVLYMVKFQISSLLIMIKIQHVISQYT